MGALTFKGGVHPLHAQHEGKDATKNKPLEEFVAQTLIIPMAQHIGAPCQPIVKVGDEVALGQPIGEPQGLGAPIHASVSGKVVAVEPRPHVNGLSIPSVVIENDEQDRLHESVQPKGTVESMSAEAIRQLIFDAGLVGMGGATFPTHVKVKLRPDQVVETLIINGAECEPYLTCDYRTMLEQGEFVIEGVRALQKAVDAKRAVIAVEDNKPEAIAHLQKLAAGTGVVIQPLKTKYPQGGEKQLIFAVTGKKISAARLPIEGNVLVNNVGTAAALAVAMRTGLPLVKRNVTITGEVINPSNLTLRVGTAFQEAIGRCGGLKGTPNKILSGGPMMGNAVFNLASAVTKGTSGILCLNSRTYDVQSNCIKCGRCITGCPMGLNPTAINAAYTLRNVEQYKRLHADNCIKCGACTYACPAQRNLCQSVDLAKQYIVAQARAAQTKRS